MCVCICVHIHILSLASIRISKEAMTQKWFQTAGLTTRSNPGQGPISHLHPRPPLTPPTLPAPYSHPSPPNPHSSHVTWSHTCRDAREVTHTSLWCNMLLDLADISLTQAWNLRSVLPQPNGVYFYDLVVGRLDTPWNWQRLTALLPASLPCTLPGVN